jgi:hypothetical protein
MDEAIVSHRGECPACGMPIPFLKAQWSLGTPFQCRQCGSELVIDKVKPLAATAVYIPLVLWARTVGFLVLVPALAIGSLLTWQFATVRLLRRAG